MRRSSRMKPLAVVTGASDGIGYELAAVLAEKGYDLVVCAEDGGIVEAAQAFRAKGAAVEHVQADLAEYDGVEKLYARIHSLGRPVDVLALNAGVGVGGDFARQTELAAELKLIDLNCKSTVHLAKRVLKDMVARKQGRVLVTSSVVSTIPGTFSAVYGASKAFTHSFAEAIREELKDTGVTVTSLRPGATETNFFHRAGMDDTKIGQAGKDDPRKVAEQGIEALLAGKDAIVAGSIKNKVEVTAGQVMPAPAKAKLHRRQAEPGSADKK